MKFDTRIAFKYILSFRSFHFISLITLISFFGIVIGVAAIICATSIFNGFREFTENQLIGLDPHIRLTAEKGAWLDNADSSAKLLQSYREIRAASSVIQGKLIAIKKANMKLLLLNGVKKEEFRQVSGMESSIMLGTFLIQDKNDNSFIVLGSGLADNIRALPGDSITLMSFAMIENAIKTMSNQPTPMLHVSGIFQSHNDEYDNLYAYTNIEQARRLLNVPENSASSIDIRLFYLEDVPKVVKIIKQQFPKVTIQTWYDLHKDLYNIMQLERIAVFVILSMIIVLAIFNVLASISMTVIEKRKDIGVLMAIGASPFHIQKIYIKEGMLIGMIGTLFGTLLGLGLCWSQLKYGWYSMNGAKYLISAVPVSVHLTDIIAVVTLSIVLSFVSGYFPSKYASKSTVTESLREE